MWLVQVEPSRPVVLYRACWHIVVANTEAIRRAGIPLEVRSLEDNFNPIHPSSITYPLAPPLPFPPPFTQWSERRLCHSPLHHG